MKSAYIHIPFCKQICSYCDFCKMIYNQKWVNRYLKSLEKEIDEKYNNEELHTIYIGGGTPSSLNYDELDMLFRIIKKFKIASDVEFSFECNLNDVDKNLLKYLYEHGVNRLSIGIESFNEECLKFLERKHTFVQAQQAVEDARTIGFNNINVDLIYAIPNQTISMLKKDITQILKLNVEHISTYSLIVEDNTKIKAKGIFPIDEDLDAKMYEIIVKKLTSLGYVHYEVSNFAKEGFYSAHNLTYWNNEYYYGFGLGAHGYVHGLRYQNTRSLTNYIEGRIILEENILSKKDIMENELMLGLRKTKGINLSEFFNKFDVNLQDVFDIKPLLKSRELIFKDGYIYINPNMLYVMNEILLKLI